MFIYVCACMYICMYECKLYIFFEGSFCIPARPMDQGPEALNFYMKLKA